MKRSLLYILIFSLLAFLACELAEPTQPKLNFTRNQLVLNKMVAIGNSITMGIQSAGIVKDFQLNTYPYLIAKKIEKAGFKQDFQLPLIDYPGLGEGGLGPMKFFPPDSIAPGDPIPLDPRTIALNLLLGRPYDNLGVSGAKLSDVLHTTSGGLFDLVLRNPNFGNTTQLEQAIMLKPTLILLWVGSSDVVGAAVNGSDSAHYITPLSDFQDQMTELLTKLRDTTKVKAAIVMANIPNVTDIPYVNTLDIIFQPIPRLGIPVPVPVMFDETFQPIVFDTTGGPLYLPLLTEEPIGTVAHLLLPALSAYQQGMGIPDSAALVNMGVPAPMASQLVAGMVAQGITPTGIPFPASYSLTQSEATTIKNTIDGYNNIIATLAGPFQILVADIKGLLNELNQSGKDGVSGKYVLFDPANTAFSLDGIHPNNAGQALIANAFIDKINMLPDVELEKVTVAEYKGQYTGPQMKKLSLKAIQQVRQLYRERPQ
ncbi:MAG: SGNH/GDSL hydrolase family protein [Calditrichia bacterium]